MLNVDPKKRPTADEVLELATKNSECKRAHNYLNREITIENVDEDKEEKPQKKDPLGLSQSNFFKRS